MNRSRVAAYAAALGTATAVFPVALPAQGTLLDGLELYYSFDADSLAPGGIADLSGNGRNGSPNDVNNAGVTDFSFSPDVPAAVGGGMSLLGTGADNILADSAAYPGVLGGASRTVALWVRVGTGVADGNNMHAVEWGANTAGNRWSFRRENAQGGSTIGGIRTEIQTDFKVSAAGESSLNDGNWHHITTVFDNSIGPGMEAVTMYFDGVAVGAYVNGGNTPDIDSTDNGPLAVGGSLAFADRQWEGWLDEVGIWSRPLTTDEIGLLAGGAVIPEPAATTTLVLGFAGILSLFFRRRRRAVSQG